MSFIQTHDFLSHLLPPYEGGRLGWGWTSWIFPPHLNPPPPWGEEVIFLTQLGYDIELFDVLHKGHDGQTSDGRLVQVKATFEDSLTFKSVPEYYLGLKLDEGGGHEEIYNGPGKLIYDKYRHRSGIGKELLSFPNTDLRQLSANVMQNDRIPKRKS